MPLNNGSRLNHYDVVALIDGGGMGEVYRATDRKLRRDVALKVLPPTMSSDPERFGRFQREARAVPALNHPNIVTIHSVEEWDGVHFLTMELVEGLTRDAVLDEVPDSTWFTNRIGRRGMSIAEIVRGPDRSELEGHLDLEGWMVTGGKSSGLQPGFRMTDPSGQLYQVDVDPPSNPELTSGTEIIVAERRQQICGSDNNGQAPPTDRMDEAWYLLFPPCGPCVGDHRRRTLDFRP
jgi:hypothetical protein